MNYRVNDLDCPSCGKMGEVCFHHEGERLLMPLFPYPSFGEGLTNNKCPTCGYKMAPGAKKDFDVPPGDLIVWNESDEMDNLDCNSGIAPDFPGDRLVVAGGSVQGSQRD